MKLFFCICCTVLFAACALYGDWHYQLESTYLGNGVFEYTLNGEHSPVTICVSNLHFCPSFTNRVAYLSTDACWTAGTNDDGYAYWNSSSDLLPNPFSSTFQAESSAPSYIQTNIYVMFLFELNRCSLNDDNAQVYSLNLAGFIKLSGLVPSLTQASVGTPTYVVDQGVLFPDVEISSMTEDTLSFDWDRHATLLIQASSDMHTWSDVAYIFTDTNTTEWTSSVPLSTYGSYFRASVAAICHDTNLIQSALFDASVSHNQRNLLEAVETSAVPAISLDYCANGFKVSFESEPEAIYAVTLVTASGLRVGEEQIICATGSVTEVQLSFVDADEPVLVDVRCILQP